MAIYSLKFTLKFLTWWLEICQIFLIVTSDMFIFLWFEGNMFTAEMTIKEMMKEEARS